MGMESSIVAKPNADGSGSWGIRYSELTMPLINAVQELDAKNKVLEADNKALKAEVAELNQLEAEVAELKNLKAELDEIKTLLNANASNK